MASVRYPGAKWLLCGGSQPAHLLALASTTEPSLLGAIIFALGCGVLGYAPCRRHLAIVIGSVYLSVFEGCLWLDVRNFVQHGNVPPSMHTAGEEVFRVVGAPRLRNTTPTISSRLRV